MITFSALKTQISSGGHSYPIYIGFATAEDILKVASAPAFTADTPHQKIAGNVLSIPIDDWQRPIDRERVAQIQSLYDNSGEFMPNPVLLGENANNPQTLTIQPEIIGGHVTNTWKLEIPVPADNTSKPLWILDGQHRINGLGKSSQAKNPIPVVFLINGDYSHYSPSTLAKIFAQVTTSAQPLHPLHDDWLSFAFDLKHYSSTHVSAKAQSNAMRSVAELCRMTNTKHGKANGFLNRVQFNPSQKADPPPPRGFSYSCSELRELLFKYYYNQPTPGAHLSPKEIAEELSLAHAALTQIVRPPHDKTVFFGIGDSAHVIMQDALIAGIATYLLKRGRPADWITVFKALGFDTTIWDFSWKKSLHGQAGNLSKALATKIFRKIFTDNTLPPGVTNLGDFMKGDNAEFTLDAFELTPKGKIKNSSKVSITKHGGARTTFSIIDATVLRLGEHSLNVAKIVVTDKNSPPGRTIDYTRELEKKKGMLLDPTKHKKPILEFVLTMHHYGDNTSVAEIDIDW